MLCILTELDIATGDDVSDNISLARCVDGGKAGRNSSSFRYCLTIGTWNVRTLNMDGNLENVIQEMEHMKLDVLGISETHWKGKGEFIHEQKGIMYKIVYSGGEQKRKGTAIILRGKTAKATKHYELKNERIICMKLETKPVNTLLVQVYAPTTLHTDDEVAGFYEQVKETIEENKKFDDVVVVMGDFNAKVGDSKIEDVVGPFGLGEKNDRGDELINFCQENNLAVMNTWYEQKKSARHTWTGPNGRVKSQIDYILVNKRYRNNITNAKSRPGADCGSDHNPVVCKLRIKLRIKKKKLGGKTTYNCDKLKNCEIRKKFADATDVAAKEIKDGLSAIQQLERFGKD